MQRCEVYCSEQHYTGVQCPSGAGVPVQSFTFPIKTFVQSLRRNVSSTVMLWRPLAQPGVQIARSHREAALLCLLEQGAVKKMQRSGLLIQVPGCLLERQLRYCYCLCLIVSEWQRGCKGGSCTSAVLGSTGGRRSDSTTFMGCLLS